MSNEVQGKIVRLLTEKKFGFIRIRNMQSDYFFHAQDYEGNFDELSIGKEVTGVIVQSPKGPRVSNVRLVEDAPYQTEHGDRISLGTESNDQD